MFSAIMIQGGYTVYFIPKQGNNTNNGEILFSTADEAKKAVEKFLVTNKQSFTAGYEVYIVNRDTQELVSTAAVPVPQLSWKDAK